MSSTHDSMSEENRRSANFHPSIWGNLFLSSSSKVNIDTTCQLQYEELKQEVRRMLKVPTDEPFHKILRLIDTIKRLGVSYYFEKEIEDVLQSIYYCDCKDDENLETTSLRFRLLRENGFNVQCETFNRFKDDEGNFKMSLSGDVKGLLELYEAAHLRLHGEHVLEEALAFTTTHLDQFVKTTGMEHPLSALVSHTLKRPIRKSFPRLEARQYISMYEEDSSHDKTLLNFAKLDFNLLQNSHREELSKISRWWKDLDFATKLPFARDRLVECYFWILGVYFEPQYSFAREILIKAMVMTSIMDDIYDVYGTYEELELLTNAIERWDIDCIDQLPAYMKLFYKALLDVYEEMEELMTKQGKLYRVQYAKEQMKQLSQAYFVEAKWYHENYVPTVEQYMKNGLVSSGYICLAIGSLVGMMQEIVTEDIFNWASNNPKIIQASLIIARLFDDITSHEFEQERGHVASVVECYVKQYGVSKEKACREFNKQIENAWKDINQEMVAAAADGVIPMPVLTRILNLTKVLHLVYGDGDGYTHVGNAVKTGITSLLIDPISV